MAEVHFKIKVQFRDEFNHMRSEVDAGLAEAAKEMAEVGRDISIAIAPRAHATAIGHKRDDRGPSIRDGMYADSDVDTARWGTTARHGKAQELGGKPHPIKGDVSFFWDKKLRWWGPGPNIISHPGNPAQPFLRPALEIVAEEVDDFIRRHMPGGWTFRRF